jgi:hypothetical protein
MKRLVAVPVLAAVAPLCLPVRAAEPDATRWPQFCSPDGLGLAPTA